MTRTVQELSKFVHMEIASPNMEILYKLDKDSSEAFYAASYWSASCTIYHVVHNRVVEREFTASGDTFDGLIEAIDREAGRFAP